MADGRGGALDPDPDPTTNPGRDLGPVEPLEPPTIFRFHTRNTTLVFVIVVIAILIAWLLVSLWTRVIENFAYTTLNLDSSSSWHALIVAMVVTVFFFATVWVIDQYDLIPGGLEPVVEGEGQPVVR